MEVSPEREKLQFKTFNEFKDLNIIVIEFKIITVLQNLIKMSLILYFRIIMTYLIPKIMNFYNKFHKS